MIKIQTQESLARPETRGGARARVLIKRRKSDMGTEEEWDEQAYLNQQRLNMGIKPIDIVNHPPHYKQGKWEVIEVLEEFFPRDPLLFNVGKYILRHEHKANPIEDLKKAAWYLNRKIAKLEASNDSQQAAPSTST